MGVIQEHRFTKHCRLSVIAEELNIRPRKCAKVEADSVATGGRLGVKLCGRSLSLYSLRICVKHEDFVIVADDDLKPNLSVLDGLKCLVYIFDVITNTSWLVLHQLLS